MRRGQTIAALPLGWAGAVASAAAVSAYLLHPDVPDGPVDAISPAVWSAVLGVLLLTVLSAIHYVSSAGALCAVSARPLSLRSTTLVQLAAAAMNRLVPGGVGGAGVNMRYLLRVGLPTGSATSAMATLALIGALTDAGYAAGVTLLGPSFGVHGATAEMRLLAQQGIRAGQQQRWLLAGCALVLIVALLVRVRGTVLSTVVRVMREAVEHGRSLFRHPLRIGSAAVASTLTTIAMTSAFVVAVESWGHATSPLPLGALAALYLVAAAVGGATPLPALLGTTELALVGGLTLAGYTTGSAVLTVAVFRAVTYWLPLPLGVWSARRLRRLSLL
jgi:uncharacterized membrane protein YbhN (UPF0104 family)